MNSNINIINVSNGVSDKYSCYIKEMKGSECNFITQDICNRDIEIVVDCESQSIWFHKLSNKNLEEKPLSQFIARIVQQQPASYKVEARPLPVEKDFTVVIDWNLNNIKFDDEQNAISLPDGKILNSIKEESLTSSKSSEKEVQEQTVAAEQEVPEDLEESEEFSEKSTSSKSSEKEEDSQEKTVSADK